jgi:SecD/SecF fusion protein
MSEVLTRSLATTSCTLLPIIALLLFGGSTLKDFAFALLIGVASGAYSSIFIASPVLTHWKERESVYRHRRERIQEDYGFVAPYAPSGADVDPSRDRARRRAGRLTEPDPEGAVSAAEFEKMKRDIAEEEAEPRRRTSTLTKRLAHTDDGEGDGAGSGRSAGNGAKGGRGGAGGAGGRGAGGRGASGRGGGRASGQPQGGGQAQGGAGQPPAPTPPPSSTPPIDPEKLDEPLAGEDFEHAPDEAEEGGIARAPKPDRSSKPRRTNRRHGRRR